MKLNKYYTIPVFWAYNSDPQITSGTSDTTFEPSKTCNRAQTVTFIWRLMGCPEPKSSYNPFVDVKSGKYYTDAVLWANENGITGGTDSTHFSPNASVTRGQAVTFLYRSRSIAQK